MILFVPFFSQACLGQARVVLTNGGEGQNMNKSNVCVCEDEVKLDLSHS